MAVMVKHNQGFEGFPIMVELEFLLGGGLVYAVCTRFSILSMGPAAKICVCVTPNKPAKARANVSLRIEETQSIWSCHPTAGA
jgi:hypothetical protein